MDSSNKFPVDPFRRNSHPLGQIYRWFFSAPDDPTGRDRRTALVAASVSGKAAMEKFFVDNVPNLPANFKLDDDQFKALRTILNDRGTYACLDPYEDPLSTW